VARERVVAIWPFSSVQSSAYSAIRPEKKFNRNYRTYEEKILIKEFHDRK
jgi:hypothetical protein